jgi:hypothetical protein
MTAVAFALTCSTDRSVMAALALALTRNRALWYPSIRVAPAQLHAHALLQRAHHCIRNSHAACPWAAPGAALQTQFRGLALLRYLVCEAVLAQVLGRWPLALCLQTHRGPMHSAPSTRVAGPSGTGTFCRPLAWLSCIEARACACISRICRLQLNCGRAAGKLPIGAHRFSMGTICPVDAMGPTAIARITSTTAAMLKRRRGQPLPQTHALRMKMNCTGATTRYRCFRLRRTVKRAPPRRTCPCVWAAIDAMSTPISIPLYWKCM